MCALSVCVCCLCVAAGLRVNVLGKRCHALAWVSMLLQSYKKQLSLLAVQETEKDVAGFFAQLYVLLGDGFICMLGMCH